MGIISPLKFIRYLSYPLDISLSDTNPLQSSSVFPLFFKYLYQRPKSSFFTSLFLVQARVDIYHVRGSKLFPYHNLGVELDITKVNILNSTSGTVSHSNSIFRILEFVTRGYLRFYLVVTVCLYPRIDGIPYTLMVLSGSDGKTHSIEDLE